MPFSTLTSKGQITIPNSIRKRFHLRTGNRLEFRVTKEGEIKLSPVTLTVDDVFGMLKRPGRKAHSVKAMDAALAKRFRDQG
jgi:AbrB family looped-hinge helix DNA binding protein